MWCLKSVVQHGGEGLCFFSVCLCDTRVGDKKGDGSFMFPTCKLVKSFPYIFVIFKSFRNLRHVIEFLFINECVDFFLCFVYFCFKARVVCAHVNAP